MVVESRGDKQTAGIDELADRINEAESIFITEAVSGTAGQAAGSVLCIPGFRVRVLKVNLSRALIFTQQNGDADRGV